MKFTHQSLLLFTVVIGLTGCATQTYWSFPEGQTLDSFRIDEQSCHDSDGIVEDCLSEKGYTKITLEQFQKIQEKERAPVDVTFISPVDHTRVWVNDTYIGQAPFTRSFEGNSIFTIEAKCYKCDDYIGSLEVRQTEKIIHLPVSQNVTNVEVTSNPSGANVYLHKHMKYIGSTPVTLKVLDKGDIYLVTASEYRASIISASEDKSIHVNLNKQTIYHRADLRYILADQNPEEVKLIIGKPDRSSESGESMYWYYDNISYDKHSESIDNNMQVVFRDGTVAKLNF